MQDITGERITPETSMGKVAFASLIGTAIEFYDFYIYGTAAALVFGAIFFPEFSEAAGTLAAFATFGVAFLARPLGGIIFGNWGDKVGRKAMLVASLLVAGIATFLIGVLPGYAAIGIIAPLILVILRFLQGIGVGGEWGGAVLMSAEYAPRGKRGFFASMPHIGPPVGFLLGSGVFILFTSILSEEQFGSWGWRLPFLLSIVLVGVGLFVRMRLAETPIFRRALEAQREAQVPILEAIRTHPKQIVLVALAFQALVTFFFVLTTFTLSYGTAELGLSDTTMLYCVMLGVFFLGVGVPIFAALSDRVGRRKLCLACVALFVLWAFPAFWLINTANPLLIVLALAVGMFIDAVGYGPMAAYFSELFSTRVRYSGASLGYQLGSLIGGALALPISSYLLSSTGGSWAISLYLVISAAIAFVSLLLLSETYQYDLEEEQASPQATRAPQQT